MDRKLIACFTLALGILGAQTATQAMDITECGQIIPRGEVGVLQNDLDCEFTSYPKRCWPDLSPCTVNADCDGSVCYDQVSGVFVGDSLKGRATLQMNGHSIDMGDRVSSAIACRGKRCTVEGPGEVFSSTVGIGVSGSADIADVVAHSCDTGISGGYGDRITATNVTVRDNTTDGLEAFKLRATNISALNNGRFGISAHRIKASTVVANGNKIGVGDFVENFPDYGLRGRIIGLQATDNTSVGVQAERITLVESTLASNGGAETGADIRSNKRPRLRNTTCSRSEVCERDKSSGELSCVVPTATWGVCVP